MLKTFILLMLFATSALARPDLVILTPSEIINLLGEQPAVGSAEEAADFQTLLKIQNLRTAKDCEMAAQDESTDIDKMFAGIVTKKEIKKLGSTLLDSYVSVGANIFMAKKIFKRARPYDANPLIKPCIDLESSYAYPSGHTTVARTYARVLSALFPEREARLMKRANEFAWNRVVGGVHHPTDIQAGFLLGDRLAEEILKEDFR